MNVFAETIADILRVLLTFAAVSVALLTVLVLTVLWLFVVRAERNVLDDGEETEAALEQGDKIAKIGAAYGMREQEAIEYNERLIAGDPGWSFGGTSEVARKLICHPTIKCRWSDACEFLEKKRMTPEQLCHGIRPAIWRRDMKDPVCRNCYVEDPFV